MVTPSISKSSNDQKMKRSLGYFHAEAAGQATSEAVSDYQAASLIAVGAQVSGVAILSAFSYLATALVCIKVPSLIGMMGSRKKAIIIMSFFDAMVWLPLAAIMLFVRPVNPMWLIPLWVINLVPSMLVHVARNSWLADVVPVASMGKYLGVRSAVTGAVYMATFYVMGYVLNMFSGQTLTGFAVIFLMAFFTSFVCFLIYGRIHDPAGLPEKTSSMSFFGFLRETRSRNLGRFILYVSLLKFAVYVSTPFIAVHLLKDLNLSYMLFALVFSSEMVAKFVIVAFWGRYADRAGNLKVLAKASFLISLAPILWVVSPLLGSQVWYLLAIQLFSGVALAGYELCANNFIYEAAPAEKRLKYIAYLKSLTTFGMALGAITGMFLLTVVTNVLGYKILALLLISGVLRGAVMIIMLPQLREVRGTMVATGANKGKAPAARPPVLVPGLFYQARQLAYAVQPAFTERVSPAVVDNVFAGKGLYHQLGRQDQFAGTLMAEAKAPGRVGLITRGLYYRPREWAQFCRPLVPEIPSEHQGQPEKRGLWYRMFNERSQFVKVLTQGVVAIEAQEEAKLGGLRGVFYCRRESASSYTVRSNEAERSKLQQMAKTGLFQGSRNRLQANRPIQTKPTFARMGRLQAAMVPIQT